MAIHIKELNIGSYRGIKDLILEDLSDVNIILGDNNCGKTSVLELITSLNSPMDFDTWNGFVNYRNNSILDFNKTFDTIDEIFDYETTNKECRFKVLTDKEYSFKTTLTDEKKIALPLFEVKKINESIYNLLMEKRQKDVDFIGTSRKSFAIECATDGIEYTSSATLYKFSIACVDYKNNQTEGVFKFPVKFCSIYPLELNAEWLEKSKYHAMFIRLLQKFDSDIEDIVRTSNSLYKVRLKNHNNAIPLNCFGDGIKQVLKIFDTIMRAEDGIICIDEFDSALHTTKMEETIKIIIEACQELNIQMFLTTHNKEALEKVLQASKRLNLLDRVNVIRLRKHPDMTIPYHWDGSNALFELSKGKELRI